MKYQLVNQSITVKIPDLNDIKKRESETQKQILRVTETIDELQKQVDSLSLRLTPAAGPPAPRAVPATT